jgi:Ca2+-binding EF-hand superfamily protein
MMSRSRYVIHAAGPVHHSAPRWQAMVFTGKSSRNDPPLGRPRTSRNYTEEQVPGLLAGAYTAALQLANRLKLTSVALPAISCDVGGYPHAEAARIALDTCLRRTAIGGLELIQFVLTNRFEESAWMQAASKKIRFNVLKASAAGASAEDEAQSEEHRALLEAFRQFDETGDGQISPQEFRRGIDAMNIELPRELLTQMVQKLCVDRVDTVWQGIDTDSSGVLDAQEFRAVMAKIDPRMGGEEVAKLAAQLDRDGDGGISKQEFSRWFMRQPARTREALVSINYKEFVAQHDPVESRLRRLFNDLDEDGSGSLDRSELHRLCKDMGAELSQRELNDAMREMDADGSGGARDMRPALPHHPIRPAHPQRLLLAHH